MNVMQVVRAAIPGASEQLCEHILWGRTAFPVGRVWPRDLYRAADRLRRATEKGIELCEFCDAITEPGKMACNRCDAALTHNTRR